VRARLSVSASLAAPARLDERQGDIPRCLLTERCVRVCACVCMRLCVCVCVCVCVCDVPGEAGSRCAAAPTRGSPAKREGVKERESEKESDSLRERVS
jgi:GTP cyclohydrolase III